MPQCKLTADQLSGFRGLKLGMHVSQPNDSEPHRRFFRIEDDNGNKSGLFAKWDADFLQNLELKDLKTVTVTSLNSELVGYEIEYSRNAVWNSPSSLLSKFSTTLNLPGDAWRIEETMGDTEFESKMYCGDFTAVLKGRRNQHSSNLVFKVETNYKNVLEAENQEKLRKQAEAFKP